MTALAFVFCQFALSSAVSADKDRYYMRQQSWEAANSGSENISPFVFRDRNRNGRYDLGENPVAHIAVELVRPDGSRLIRRSNRHGFVNFLNSLTYSGVDIGSEGEFDFEVVPPPNWTVTSGNAKQTAYFESKPETRPGIVANRAPHPIGIAPMLRLSGRVITRVEGEGFLPVSGALVSASSSPDQIRKEVATKETGEFTFQVGPGSWLVQLESPDTDVQIERMVRVIDAPIHLSAIILGDPIRPELAVHVQVDFDQITSLPITKMPSYPHRLEWVNLVVTDNQTYRGPGYINNTVTGHYVGYNSSGYPVTVASDEPFDFVGAYFGVAWPQAEGEALDIRAWRGDQLVGEETLLLSSMGPFWFEADYRSIDRIEFATRHYWQFVMDEPVFRFTEP